MSDFNKSDYAINKNAAGIVYRFNGQTVEVTKTAYIEENPGKTEADFQELKTLSDSMFHEEDLADTKYAKRHGPLFDTDMPTLITASPEEGFIERADMRAVRKATRQLLGSGNLTETQERRFRMHFFKGQSLREIAAQEGTSHIVVRASIQQATKKLKLFFDKQG